MGNIRYDLGLGVGHGLEFRVRHGLRFRVTN